jgi:hypothetical protein
MTDRALDAFAARVATPLKAREQGDPELAARVMAMVRDETDGKRAGRLRHRSARLPLSVLTMAAGVVALFITGADLIIHRAALRARHPIAVVHDTVHVVRFVLVAPGASRVALVGDFNHWNGEMHLLAEGGAEGVWSVSVPLPRGRHEYAFVIDGRQWVADPSASGSVVDELGGESSVITVGTPAAPSAS